MRLTVTRAAYLEALDPSARDAPKEKGWPEPDLYYKGSIGWSDVDRKTASEIAYQLRLIAAALGGEGGTAGICRSLVTNADKIEESNSGFTDSRKKWERWDNARRAAILAKNPPAWGSEPTDEQIKAAVAAEKKVRQTLINCVEAHHLRGCAWDPR